MKIIVDTDVWSEAFRKKQGSHSQYVNELRLLIEEARVEMIGVIRMEILCGLHNKPAFEIIRNRIDSFPDRNLDSNIFTMAAQFFNLCRSKGIQGSNNDFIICACAVSWKTPILTKDKDFIHYQKLLPIELHTPRI